MQSSPEYIFEQVSGFLLRREGRIELALSSGAIPDNGEVITEGDFALRYGIEFLRRPYALVPGMFIAESGAIKVGHEAWDWLWSKFQLYPRAEIIGMRTDGKEDQVFLRELDFGMPPSVLIYEDDQTWIPLGQVVALHRGDSGGVPELLDKVLG